MLEEYKDKLDLKLISISEDRQRKKLVNIEDLAGAIRRTGLLNPIIVRREGNLLIAGERRFTAYRSLRDAYYLAHPETASSPWDAIPYRYLDTLDPNIAAAIELEENTQRVQLSWQDHAVALHKIHELRETSAEGTNLTKTAAALGISPDTLTRNLTVARKILAGDKAFEAMTGLTEAYNKIKREMLMAMNEDVSKMLHLREPVRPSAPTPADEGVSPAPPLPSLPSRLSPILNADFCEWAKTYSGEPFNFLHCDFPYGINHQNSAQGNVESYGAYNDTEEVYWKLLNALADNKSRLFYDSAHIIFWFSMKHIEKTLAFFRERFPEFVFEDYPLIWTKRQGIAPDPNRRPQRNYETALFGFSSGRQIVRLCSNVIAAPPGVKFHASQKAPRALRHLFRLVVNNDTRMLDPTCGSGTALQAAMSLGAREVVGLELDPKFAKLANDDYAVSASMDFNRGLEDFEEELP